MPEPETFSFKPISFFTAVNLPISFIIHVKDQFSKTSLILEKILTSKNPYEIILVNDNSINKEYFKQLVSHFKFIKLLENKSTRTDAINDALDLCEGNWIFYINADCVPNNLMWLNGIINSMMKLKVNNVKFISPIIENLSFFNSYKGIEEDKILSDHFLPFNVGFFHKDLFKTIGKLEPKDDLVEISRAFYEKMNKRNFKQAICPFSIFTI